MCIEMRWCEPMEKGCVKWYRIFVCARCCVMNIFGTIAASNSIKFADISI